MLGEAGCYDLLLGFFSVDFCGGGYSLETQECIVGEKWGMAEY